ncbi:MAG: type IV pilus biogenesis protein PilM, partial [Mycobacterium leprae]
IKVVEVRAYSRYRFRVHGCGKVPTPPGSVEGGLVQDPVAVGKAIRQAVKAAGIKARKAAIAVHPQVAFLRTLSFPVMPAAEVRGVIELQPERYIPNAGGEETQFDFAILPHPPEAAQMSVVVAAAPRRVVADLMKACRVAGLTPVSVDMEPLALQRAVLAAQRDMPDDTVAVVDLGEGQAKISLFDQNVPVVSRVLAVGAGAGPAATGEAVGEATEDLFLDIRRSLEYGLSQSNRRLSRLFVTGGGAVDEYQALSLAGYIRGFMSYRLTPDFVVEALRHPFLDLSGEYMLAFGLSIPQELFYDSNQPAD